MVVSAYIRDMRVAPTKAQSSKEKKLTQNPGSVSDARTIVVRGGFSSNFSAAP